MTIPISILKPISLIVFEFLILTSPQGKSPLDF